MSNLPYRCAVCGEVIHEGPDDRRLVAAIVRAGEEVPTDGYYFHRAFLASVLHPSVPLGEVLEPA